MNRVFTLGGCTLINGNSLAVLDEIPDESFDALVTDPEFGIGFNYDGEIEETNDPESYWRLVGPIYAKMLAKVKPGGFVAVWQTQLYFENFWRWFGKGIHIYAGCKNFVQIRKTKINYGYDPIIMFYKDGAERLAPEKQKRSIDYYAADYFDDGRDMAFVPDFFVADTAHFGNREHPCPRALGQVDQIVTNFTVERANVLDGFAGWATICVSCMRNGRTSTGIEKNPVYFDASVRRLTETWSNVQARRNTLDRFTGKV